MDERRQLLAAIEDFCAREGMAPTAFGRKAMGDGRLVARLRNGYACCRDTSGTIENTKPEISLDHAGQSHQVVP